MAETTVEALASIRTTEEMMAAFRDEQHCRRLLEKMVAAWQSLLGLWL